MPKAYKKCVREVARKGTARNPHAVCTAANAGNIKQVRKREARARHKAKSRKR